MAVDQDVVVRVCKRRLHPGNPGIEPCLLLLASVVVYAKVEVADLRCVLPDEPLVRVFDSTVEDVSNARAAPVVQLTDRSFW